MIEQPFKRRHFEWLVESSGAVGVDAATEDYWQTIDFPIPSSLGKAGSLQIDLSLGITLNSVKFDFLPGAVGKILPGAIVNVEFTEPTFQATTFRGVRCIYDETDPPSRFGLSEGIDLFRHTDRYQTTVAADCGFSGSAMVISVCLSSMDLFIGQEMTSRLIDSLGMRTMPATVARRIPLHVSHHLATAITPSLREVSLKLFAQAKILQYLAVLVDHLLGANEEVKTIDSCAKQRVRSLYDYLIGSEGKLPSLEDLAMQFGRSAKLLNEEFACEYGQSIYAFMTDYRLMQAHAALQHTNVTIKQLSSKLGYAHVSNFTIAFKRKFGYPPGSLRRHKP